MRILHPMVPYVDNIVHYSRILFCTRGYVVPFLYQRDLTLVNFYSPCLLAHFHTRGTQVCVHALPSAFTGALLERVAGVGSARRASSSASRASSDLFHAHGRAQNGALVGDLGQRGIRVYRSGSKVPENCTRVDQSMRITAVQSHSV